MSLTEVIYSGAVRHPSMLSHHVRYCRLVNNKCHNKLQEQ